MAFEGEGLQLKRLRLDGDGIDIDAATVAVETHVALYKRVDGVVATETDVVAGMPLGPTLAQNDVAGNNGFTTKLLNAATLTSAVATVLNASLSFLMSHGK